MKQVLFPALFLSTLAAITLPPSVSLKSLSKSTDLRCESCYSSSPQEFTACLQTNCKSEILSKSKLFKSDIEFSQGCQSCLSLNDESEYFQCVNFNCQSEIAAKAQELAIKTPYVLRKKLPIKVEVCEDCSYSYFDGGVFADCYYYTCREEILDKKVLMKSLDNTKTSLCNSCLQFNDQEYYNCAYAYCKSEITELFNNLYKKQYSNPNEDLECTSDCYDAWYYGSIDYEDCVNLFCRQTSALPQSLFSLRPDSEMSACDSCHFYFEGDLKSKCVQYNCLEALVATSDDISNLKLCINSKDSATQNCEKLIEAAAEKYFEGKPSFLEVRPKISMGACEACGVLYTGEALFNCIAWSCKNEMSDKIGIEKSSLSYCTDICYSYYNNGVYNYNEYQDCYYYECHSEIIELYNNMYTKESSPLSKGNKLYYVCEECFFDEFDNDYDCFECFREPILDKSSLFAVAPTETSKCNSCFSKQSAEYNSCIYLHCKQEISERAKFVALRAPELLMSRPLVKASTCKNVAALYSNSNSKLVYQSYYYNCRDEAVSKQALFADTSKLGEACLECELYDDDEYFNCAYIYCKNEITAKVHSLYADSSEDDTMEKTDPCVDECFYSWYYYGEDYDQCYSNCKPDVAKLAKKLKIELSKELIHELVKKDLSQSLSLNKKAFANLESEDEIIEERTDPCVDECFYSWYYYGEDYDNCYEMCSVIQELPPKKLHLNSPEKILQKLVREKMSKPSSFIANSDKRLSSSCGLCFSAYPASAYLDCVAVNCKSEVIEKVQLSQKKKLEEGIKMPMKCDTCFSNYYYKKSSYDQYLSCAKWYCKNAIMQEAYIYQTSLPAIQTIKDSSAYTSESCSQYAKNEVYGYNYYACFNEFSKSGISLSENKVSEGSSYINKAGFAASAILLGALVYMKYSKKREEENSNFSESQTPYKIIL